ncbi:MAG: hypothetical protein JWM28_4421 [Chitinophagaceae bacterium]|nr:hypothetical protein [Chitinophagaceae bacterium]
MKTLLFFTALLITSFANAQKVDSIFFHLYTDSLKKGVHNYINVDGKLSDGRWLPLTAKEIQFSASAGKFEGNDLVLSPDFSEEKVIVKAVLRNNTAATKEITIWVKKKPDDEILPTKNDVLNSKPSKRRARKNQ